MTINYIQLKRISKLFPVNMRVHLSEIIILSHKYMPSVAFIKLMDELEQKQPVHHIRDTNVYFKKIRKLLFNYRDSYLYVISKCGAKMQDINYLGFLKEVLDYFKTFISDKQQIKKTL